MKLRKALIVFGIVGLLAVAGIAVAMAQTDKPARPGGPQQMAVVGVSNEGVIAIKDHGDSQTVMVFKVNPEGKVKLTDKKKFFY